MPAPDPRTRLRRLALDLDCLSEELDNDTQFDPSVFRYLRAQLLEIADELDHSPGPDSR
jgi:hypothetical protein